MKSSARCAPTPRRAAPPDRRILLRIGINLGDAIVESDVVYGDGVNVAFRLQGLADPGGIVVSREVRNEARDRLPDGFAAMGEVEVKNHPRPLKPYRLLEGGAEAAPAAPPAAPRAARLSPLRPVWRRRLAPALAAVAMIAAGAGLWAWRPWEPPAPGEAANRLELPAIAVLPFLDMSGDPEAAYLGQGVAEDITTALATFPGIRVLSRTTSFSADLSQPVEAIGKQLGARYVLEGGVRRLGDQVRVTAQLIDAETGGHVLAETFDETGKDVLAIQADVAERVFAAAAGTRGDVFKEPERLAWAKNPLSLDEHDYFLRGHALFMTFAREDLAPACAIWREGLEKFPRSALLRTKLAFCHMRRILLGLSEDPAADMAEMARLAAEARAMPDRSKLAVWYGHWVDANVAFFHEDWPGTFAAARDAVALVPNEASALGDLASIIASTGYVKEGIEWAERAARIDPSAILVKFGLLAAHVLGGDPARAVEAGEAIADQTAWYVAALVRAGRLADARAASERLQRAFGGWTIAQEAALPMRADLEAAYLDDLRKAGIPE